MCGIAGIFTHRSDTPDRDVLSAMARAMRYRGPDDEGIYQSEHIGLVHRRLSVRDLSASGHCPMGTPDGNLQIVFNGEIYNWRELRLELEALGFVFRSQSDTEVVLHGYQVWGEGLLRRLRGMFAIAIWDKGSSSLFLARDRAGEKPLFYCSSADGLAFASGTESLRRSLVSERIDPVAIGCHLTLTFIPSKRTVWKGVKVLPPGHFLRVEPGVEPVVSRYWDFPRLAPSPRPLADCERAAEAVLNDSVERCLDADVPVGLFLSGGVDSSLIAALAARHQPGMPAFSVGFSEVSHSELPHAEKVARYLGLEHHVSEVCCDDVIKWLPHLVKQYGQPFGDSSAVPSYGLACLAREYVTVCLGGDGGDEAFGGYWRMQSGVYAARYGAVVPAAIRESFIPYLARGLGTVGDRLLALNNLSMQAPGSVYGNSQSWFDRWREIAGPALKEICLDEFIALRVGAATGRPEASVIQRLLYDDFQVQLPDAYLTKVDVASMAASLEVRSPLLDRCVLEFAWSLPDAAKLNWGRRKWLLKRLAARYVPPEVVYRPKMGFAMPLAEWFRGALGAFLESFLDDSVAIAAGWLDERGVRKCLVEHLAGQDHSTRLWLVLWLELWFRLVAFENGEYRAQASQCGT